MATIKGNVQARVSRSFPADLNSEGTEAEAVGRGAIVVSPPVAAETQAPERDSDTALVAAVRRGDDRAFEQLYSRYQRRISVYVFGMVKDHGRAEDITQEVFISALRRMRDTDRAIAFKPWVYEIAKNACIDQFRRSRRAEEVSFDAGDELGVADQGRLIAGEPTPDAAVDAKQQLDHLCGAFGGLSDSHHEILVLREFEGLSYSEIGDRMGLSRPGVESTLFRARKRLGEEYDELITGQRCVRIQSIISSAASSSLGARDTRRLARHLSHCQPCRRQAVAAGIDTAAILARKPVRRRVAEKLGGLLPIPAFLRTRGWLGGGQMVAGSEPMTAAWSKAAAVAATVLVVGAGAGVEPQIGGAAPDARSQPKVAASAGRSNSSATAANARARTLGLSSAPTKTTGSAGSRRGASKKAAGDKGASAPTGGGGSTSPTAPASTGSGGSATSPSSGTRKPSGSGSTPKPTADLPGTTQQAADQVDKTVRNTGQAVTNTVDGAANTVGGAVTGAGNTVGGATGAVGGAVGGATGAAGGAVGGATGAAGGAVGGATGAAGGAVGGATGGAGGAVGGATGAAGGAVEDTTGAVGGAVGGATGSLPGLGG
jgi:RNA polymerase sigma factor (sigma-70 family)